MIPLYKIVHNLCDIHAKYSNRTVPAKEYNVIVYKYLSINRELDNISVEENN